MYWFRHRHSPKISLMGHRGRVTGQCGWAMWCCLGEGARSTSELRYVAPIKLHRPLAAEHPQQHEDPFPRCHAGIEPVQSGERAGAHPQLVPSSERCDRLRWWRQSDQAVALAGVEIGNHGIRNARWFIPMHDDRGEARCEAGRIPPDFNQDENVARKQRRPRRTMRSLVRGT